MKFWLGLAIGAVLGGAAMYLAVERPWSRGPGAPAVAAAPSDAGAGEPRKPGKRRRAGRAGGAREAVPIDDTIVLTDADRRLEWRGDEVALPPQRLDMAGGADDGRALSGSEIQGALDRDGQAVVDCIVRAIGGAPLAGAVTLQLLVDPGGRVVKVRMQAASYLFGHGLYACARRAAQGLGFPGTGAHTVVTAPFELN